MSSDRVSVSVILPEHPGDYYTYLRNRRGEVKRVLASYNPRTGHWFVGNSEVGCRGEFSLNDRSDSMTLVSVEIPSWIQDPELFKLKNHDVGCRYRIAVSSGVQTSCSHGHLVCESCDPCSCKSLHS